MGAEKVIFNFSRDLPSPFDTLPNKKVKMGSKYTSAGTTATLNLTVLKALIAYCKCTDGSAPGAVGQSDQKTVAEYKSSNSPDEYHLVVYNPDSGTVMATVYDKNTETITQYSVRKDARDGAAIIMAMIPVLLGDQEFEDNFSLFYKEYSAGFPDVKKAAESGGILCDNVYRRVIDETCPAHAKLSIDASGNVTRISTGQLDANNFAPTAIHTGVFSIFTNTPVSTVYTPAEQVDNNDFVNQYKLNPARMLSALEQHLVPVLKSSYILPPEIVNVCKHAFKSTGKQTQMRNFLLRGPAGTGKTEGAKAVAAGLGLPYMKYTCSANTEVFDFIGQVFPETDEASTGNAVLDEERRMLKEMGGMTYDNVAKLINLPGLDDMDYDPAGVYQALTGTEKAEATSQECIALVLSAVTEKIQKLSQVTTDGQSTGQTYTYVETDFIKALKNGYVVEIQEPSTIMQPGVLVGLNSLLEQDGTITLPTGEIIKRHPDAVVIVTTNIDYEGCRGMNQSVLDRMNLIADIDLPSPEVMTQRAMSVTGSEDDMMVSKMVQVVNDMADYCRKNNITDGSVGMRSLIDWIVSADITEDPYESALTTVVSRATSNEEDRAAIISAVLEPFFAPKRRARAAS